MIKGHINKSDDIKITQNKLKQKVIFVLSLRLLYLHVSFEYSFMFILRPVTIMLHMKKIEFQKALWLL